MAVSRWRTRLSRTECSGALRSWLTESRSLTVRCQRMSSSFRVRVLHQGWGRALGDSQGGKVCLPVRDVLLECDGAPVIFAHTTLCTAAGGRLRRWLARLGERSLGSVLFRHPGFRRGALEYLRLNAQQPLFRQALAGQQLPGALWARRSLHRLGREALLVTEVFLPALGD